MYEYEKDLRIAKKARKANRKFYQKKRYWLAAFIIIGMLSPNKATPIASNTPPKKVSISKNDIIPKVIKAPVKAKIVKPKVIVLTAAQKKVATDAAAKKAKMLKELTAATEHKAWIDNQFSPFTGIHYDLENLVKDNLNDDKSFKHVKTTYVDHGSYLIIKMTYRAKNAYGGLILQNVTAKADKNTNMITIIAQNN
jgi:hypothetical protein